MRGTSTLTVVVMAKSPRPGRVKTRLAPTLTPQQSADVATACLRDTLAAVVAAPARRRLLCLDGPAGAWVPPGLDVVPQCGGDLSERLGGALDGLRGPVLLIGMDTPQVTPSLLDVAGLLDRHDALLGPAEDGGFWALGLRRPDGSLVRGVPMSTSSTGTAQRDRLEAAGLHVGELPTLRDVDTVQDLLAVAALAPSSRVAAVVRALPVLAGWSA